LPIAPPDAEDRRGYARAQDETFYARQAELLARVVAESDVGDHDRRVRGKRLPVLITADMVRRRVRSVVCVGRVRTRSCRARRAVFGARLA